MKLSDKELDIIACMAFDASQSVAEVSTHTGIKDHVVRHTLKKLLDEETIRLRPYVNPYALGLTEFHAEVVLDTPGEAALSALTKAFVDAPTSTFVSEVTGDFHLSVMFLLRSFAGIPRFFDEICQKVPDVRFRKSVSAVIQVTLSHPNRGSNPGQNSSVSYRAGGEQQRYDELDQRILILLGSGEIVSRRELSKRLGAPQSTIDYRIQTLQQRGILLAIGYTVPTYHDGLSEYTLRIIASRPCTQLQALVTELSLKHPAVRSVLHVSGVYDYILGVRLSHPGLISAFTQELWLHLDSYVSRIDVISELRTHKAYVNPEDIDLISKLEM